MFLLYLHERDAAVGVPGNDSFFSAIDPVDAEFHFIGFSQLRWEGSEISSFSAAKRKI